MKPVNGPLARITATNLLQQFLNEEISFETVIQEWPGNNDDPELDDIINITLEPEYKELHISNTRFAKYANLALQEGWDIDKLIAQVEDKP